MTGGIFGLLFGDKEYISRALFLRLILGGVKLVTSMCEEYEKRPYAISWKDYAVQTLYCRNYIWLFEEQDAVRAHET
jgi:hypothetical protein